MVNYCTAEEVQLIVKTRKDPSEINDLIVINSGIIDKKVGAQSTDDQLIKKACMIMTAVDIREIDPQSVSIGEYNHSFGKAIERMEKRLTKIMRLYKTVVIVQSSYQEIDEDGRYTNDTVRLK